MIAQSNKTGQRAFGPNELRDIANVPLEAVWSVIGALPETIAGPTMDLWSAHYGAVSEAEARDALAPPKPKPKAWKPSRLPGRDVRTLTAEEYVPALTGREVLDGGRRIHCPLPSHEDRHPSFSVRGDRWRCFGCGEGGDIFELASLLWGRSKGTKQQFAALATELEERLG